MNNDKLIAQFMGYEVVRIGYWSTNGNGDTTAWQRRNKDWLEKPEIIEQYNNSVGDYYAKVSENVIIRQQDVDYTNWDDLMPVVDKINKSSFDDTRGIELINAIHKYVARVQILDAHLYVCEFIKWYNDQKK